FPQKLLEILPFTWRKISVLQTVANFITYDPASVLLRGRVDIQVIVRIIAAKRIKMLFLITLLAHIHALSLTLLHHLLHHLLHAFLERLDGLVLARRRLAGTAILELLRGLLHLVGGIL